MPLRRWLLFAAFVLAALLFSGGNRLVGTDAPAPLPVTQRAHLPALPATLEAAPDKLPAPPMTPVQAGAEQAPVSRRIAAHGARQPLLARDANGNVLRAGRYSRAVYQAFALGDMPG